jgi:hypothetical protein
VARFTEKLRKSAGVRDADPVAPVFDAVDLVADRVDQAIGALQDEATRRRRRDLVRGIGLAGAAVALIGGLAFGGAAIAVRSAEEKSAERLRLLDDERARSFDARVETRAAAVAFDVVTQANSRAAAAEALLEVARGRVAALAGGTDPGLRDLLKASATAKRDDIAIVLRLMSHQDPNVRKTCDALSTVSPAMVGRLLEYFTANKGQPRP